MEKSDEKLPSSSAVARVPAFTITPPARCMSLVGSPGSPKCGELATRIRRGNMWFSDSFHCERHAAPTDLGISGEYVIRRVRVTCDVLMAGVDERQNVAQTEAVARLASAVAAAGGVLDVKITTSQIGRYPAVAGVRSVAAASGSGE